MFDEDLMVKSSLYSFQNLLLACLQWCFQIGRERRENEESLFCEVCLVEWGLGFLYGALINLIRLH